MSTGGEGRGGRVTARLSIGSRMTTLIYHHCFQNSVQSEDIEEAE